MFKFLRSKTFYFNTIAVSIIIGATIWGIFKFIDNYTHHGETISVPTLEGLSIDEFTTLLEEKKLRFVIQDSIFKEKSERGIVLDQNPLANSLVKENRTIYITISKMSPPKITMPDVVGGSHRMAIAKLNSYGLNIVDTKFKVSEYSGTVLGYEINDKTIQPGDKIDEDSPITLLVGRGKGDQQIMAPYLINLTESEAQNELQLSSLSMGFADYTDCGCVTAEDTLNAKIYKQYPIRSEKVALYLGSSVDLYFTCDSTIIQTNLSSENDTIITTGTTNVPD